jgi:segregation and condensation protein B
MDDNSDNGGDTERDDDLDEEFSLDQLSRAYAEVIREKNRESGDGQKTESTEKALPKKTPPAIPSAKRDNSDHKSDDAPCPLTPESIIEAMLFVGTPKGIPFQISQIASELRDVSEEEVVAHIADLNAKYKQEKAAFEIVVNQESVQMALVKELSALQNDFFGRNKQFQLSQTAIDVLAVVAYNQPLTRAQVETARGKSSGSILAQLVRRDLLALDMDEPKPAQRTYTTTDRFLQLFHLSQIEDLPQSHDVSEFEEYIDD